MTFRQILVGMTGLVVGAALLSRQYPSRFLGAKVDPPHIDSAAAPRAGALSSAGPRPDGAPRSAAQWNPLDEASDAPSAVPIPEVSAEAMPADIVPTAPSAPPAPWQSSMPAAAAGQVGEAVPLSETSDVLTKAMLQIEQTKRQLLERQDIIKELEARRRQIQTLEKWTESLTTKLGEQAGRLREVERARAQLAGDIESSQHRIGYLQEQVHELESSRATLIQENQALAERAAQREAGLLAQKQQAEQELSARTLDVTRLTVDLEESRAVTSNLSDELANTREHLAHLKAEWDELRQSNASLQDERDRLQEQVARAREAQDREVEALNQKIAQLTQAMDEGRQGDRERRRQLDGEVKQLREEQRRVQRALSDAIKQAEALAKAVKVKDDLVGQLKAALEARETQLKRAESGLSTVQGKQDQLQQGILDATAQADDMAKTLQARDQVIQLLREELGQQQVELQQAEAVIRLLERERRRSDRRIKRSAR